ncbi:AraC family transcriptional regulator [Vallitalea okinawensis]|uniref:AraC family transcriptional regulator n=1 Tax=Vallitalea okinawensis TaxID=2078660 RepID=UPI0014782419|nr:AraC family transcriptional regulator [Vallitalea okinawensis]
MQNTDIFNRLSDNIDIKVKTHIICHRNDWYESGSRVQYDLWIMLEGSAIVKMNREEYFVQAGEMFLFYPDVQYEAYTTEKECTFLYSHFDFRIGNNGRILDEFNFDGHLQHQPMYAEEKTKFIDNFSDYKNKESMSAFLHKAYFESLLAKIIDYQSSEKEPKNIKKSMRITKLQPAIDYITEHVDQSISIGILAVQCNMSEKYFITLFKGALGITPGNYIIQVKMTKALEYLYEQRYSIKEIAYMLGYTDPYTFSKAFKKYHQVPPTRYKLDVHNLEN